MPDPVPAPATPEKPKRIIGDLDKQAVAEIKLGEDVAEAASDPARLAKLGEEEVAATAPDDLLTLCHDARTIGGKIVGAKTGKKDKTKGESTATKTLLAELRGIQKRAKRKFAKDKNKQAAYRIGKTNFGDNRDSLEEDAQVIIDLATADALPGMTPAKLTAAKDALKAWKKADEDQGGADGDKSDLINQFKTKLGEVNDARRDMQIAADTVWPHTSPANASVRRLFKLPVDRPLSV